MGKFLGDPRKGLLRIRVGKRDFKGLVSLGNSVHTGLTGNTNFTTPTPGLTTLATDILNLNTAMALTNFKRNHGSKAQIQDTIDKASTLRGDLIQLLNYVANTASQTGQDEPAITEIISTAGFGLRHIRARKKATSAPRFVQMNNNRVHNPGLFRLKWSKPLGQIKGQPVQGYNIVIDGIIKYTTTATFFVFPSLATPIVEGYIVPFNARGNGRPVFFTIRGHV